MILNVVTQVLQIGAGVVIGFLIGYLISYFLSKISDKLIFLTPSLFGIFSVVFMILAMTSDSWAGLGLMILAIFSMLAFIGSMVASIIIYKKHKKNNIL